MPVPMKTSSCRRSPNGARQFAWIRATASLPVGQSFCGVAAHQRPRGRVSVRPPATLYSKMRLGSVSTQNQPLARRTPGMAPARTAWIRWASNGRRARQTNDSMPYSSCFGDVIRGAVQLLDPERPGAGLLEVEEAGVEDAGQWDVAEVGLDDPRAGVEAADDTAGVGQPLGACGGHLVEDDNVGELDLVDEKLDQGTLVLGVALLAAVAEEVVAGEVAREVGGVDHGQHRVEPGDVGKADAGGVAEVEGGGDRQRLGDAGRTRRAGSRSGRRRRGGAPRPGGRRVACSRCTRWSSRPGFRLDAAPRGPRSPRAGRRCSPRTYR